MDVEHVAVADLLPDPANVRLHPERNVEAIKASLARFGQQKPIVVDANGIVRAGNGTLHAARALGWDSVAVVRTPLAGSEATAYSIADNRTSELAEWDDTALAEQLRALQSEDFDLGAVGYTDDEIGSILDGLAGEIGGPGPGPVTIDDVPEKYEIVVECRDEAEQRTLFGRWQAEGLTCRVLTL